MFSPPTMCIPINTHVGQHHFSCNTILAADYWLAGEKKVPTVEQKVHCQLKPSNITKKRTNITF